MVKIYKVRPDVTQCQWIMPCDKQFIEQGNLVFDGKPRSETWNPPQFYIHNPVQARSNFFIVSSGAIAFDETARNNDKIDISLEMSGEILPILLETGERLYILNVTEVANALNTKDTLFRRDPSSGINVAIQRYDFFTDRFTQSSIFKIPESRRAEILTFSNLYANPEEEFYASFNASGLKGLKFEEIWSGGEG